MYKTTAMATSRRVPVMHYQLVHGSLSYSNPSETSVSGGFMYIIDARHDRLQNNNAKTLLLLKFAYRHLKSWSGYMRNEI